MGFVKSQIFTSSSGTAQLFLRIRFDRLHYSFINEGRHSFLCGSVPYSVLYKLYAYSNMHIHVVDTAVVDIVMDTNHLSKTVLCFSTLDLVFEYHDVHVFRVGVD